VGVAGGPRARGPPNHDQHRPGERWWGLRGRDDIEG